MAEEKEQEKKIIVDEDWKQQAQKEKEILAAQEEAEKKDEPQEETPRGPLPEGNFAALISMLATQAFFALGLLQIKGQEERKPDLEMAKKLCFPMLSASFVWPMLKSQSKRNWRIY
ncbi:MAG: hypothetical protein ACYSUX_01015 [Planctomycetota bacterium]|jgi:hypothetical protein